MFSRNSLFAYGTLLVPEIWRAVTGCDCLSEPATLPGYAIYRVKGADFPGITPASSAESVSGRVFHNLDPKILDRLDAYEDGFYQRRDVILLDQRGNQVGSEAYVIPTLDREKWLTDETWTLEWFCAEALQKYLFRHGFTR